MSSLTRRIQRTVGRDDEGNVIQKRRHFGGRGQRLGTVNPKDPCRTGKRKAPKKWRSTENAPPAKPALRFKESTKASREACRIAHKAKMEAKARHRETLHKALSDRRAGDATPYLARTNRHTGKPHEHKREIARRLRQRGEV